MQVITAGIPEMDACPILTRIKAFIIDQGVVVTLRHTMRDRQGNPLDLEPYLDNPSSTSESEIEGVGGTVVLLVRDWLGTGIQATGPRALRELEGRPVDPGAGTIEADLTARIVEASGIYELTWGIKDADGNYVASNSGILSVERNLLTARALHGKNPGPPTINEIRMWMMDSSPSENTLLDQVEFSDEQICLALTKPIQQWNESPPPLRPAQTTRTFPFRGAWASAALGELYIMAAAHYRRNALGGSAGGLQINDKGKEKEYMAEGLRLREEYTAWMLNKKVSINMTLFSGGNSSTYSRMGW
jgi:hypothetical protein